MAENRLARGPEIWKVEKMQGLNEVASALVRGANHANQSQQKRSRLSDRLRDERSLDTKKNKSHGLETPMKIGDEGRVTASGLGPLQDDRLIDGLKVKWTPHK